MRFSTVTNDGHVAAQSCPMIDRMVVERLEGHDRLPLEHPEATVETVPVPQHVQGVEELPDGLGLRTRCFGALRYHASLKARSVKWLSSFGGTTGGVLASARAWKSSGRSAFRGAISRSASRVAKPPRVTTERPIEAPVVSRSIHATV